MEIPALLDRDKIVSTLRVIDGNIKCGNEHLKPKARREVRLFLN